MKGRHKQLREENESEINSLSESINHSIGEGRRLFDQKNYKGALDHFKHIIEKTNSSVVKKYESNYKSMIADVHFYIGRCCQELDDHNSAIYNLTNAMKGNISRSKVCHVRAYLVNTLIELERHSEAIKHLNILLKTKEVPDKDKASIHYNIAGLAEDFELDIGKGNIEKHWQAACNLGYPDAKDRYTNCLAKKFFTAGDFKKAIVFLQLLAKSPTPDNCVIALYNLGLVYLDDRYEEQNRDKALNYFKQCVEFYNANKNYSSNEPASVRSRKAVANAACLAAELLVQDEKNVSRNDRKQFEEYNKLAAELHHPYSLYHLGYKYENEGDINKAIPFYREAAGQGHTASQIALGRILLNSNEEAYIKEGIQVTEKAVKAGEPVASYNLGGHYFNKKDFETAFSRFKEAAALGHVLSIFYVGLMLDQGRGVEEDKDKAEHCYLLAAKRGHAPAFNNLAILYQDKIKAIKDIDKATEEEINTAKDCIPKILHCLEQSTQTFPISLKDFCTTIKDIQSFKLNIHNHFVAVNHAIANITVNQDLTPQERICQILESNLSVVNAINMATVIHGIGRLTDVSLSDREFHNSKIPDIFVILQKAWNYKNQFTTRSLTNIIEGMSKLYLKRHVKNFSDIVGEFYQVAYEMRDKLALRELINIIYAASRLDPTHLIFKNQLPSLVSKAFENLDLLDPQSLTNLIYALALFDNGDIKLIEHKDLGKLISHIQASDDADQSALRQSYTALFYFDNKYSPDAGLGIKKGLLATWRAQLSKQAPETKDSNLQKTVISRLKKYVTTCESEKIINTFPVDAFCQIGQQKFIVQVDGPSHYLHDEKKPVPTLKTRFRDKFLALPSSDLPSPCPVVCIPYDQWQQTAIFERDAFLLKKLEENGIVIDSNERQVRNATKKLSDPGSDSAVRFFHAPTVTMGDEKVIERPTKLANG